MALADQLRRLVSGQVFGPEDGGRADEMSAFDPTVVAEPDVALAAATVDDVVAGVRFAAEHGLPIAVMGTGHADVAPLRGGLLIGLRRLTEVHVDSTRRTAAMGAGATWTDVLPLATSQGLAPLCGSAPDVGAVGLLLGGGLGPLCRTFGCTADFVCSFDVVTADAQRLTVDAEHHPDLYWALRGGKGALAVVVSATLELLPLTTIWGGSWYVDAADVAGTLRAFQELVADDLPHELTTSFAVLRLPDRPAVPELLRGRTVGHVRVGYVGDPDVGRALIAPLRDAAVPIVGDVGPLPYAQIGTIHNDPVTPTPHVDGGLLLHELSGSTVDALLGAAGPDTASHLTIAEVRHLGGAVSGSQPGDAVGGRDAAFGTWLSTVVPPGGDRHALAVEVRGALDDLGPWSTGAAQINFFGNVNTAAEHDRSWPAAVAARLAEVRRRYDPDGRLVYEPVTLSW